MCEAVRRRFRARGKYTRLRAKCGIARRAPVCYLKADACSGVPRVPTSRISPHRDGLLVTRARHSHHPSAHIQLFARRGRVATPSPRPRRVERCAVTRRERRRPFLRARASGARLHPGGGRRRPTYHAHKSRVRNAAMPAASTATIHPHAHASSIGGGGDVTENGFTAVPLAFAFAAAAVKIAGCSA